MPPELEYPFPTLPAPGETLEVAPGVHWIRMTLPFALNHINLWLLDDREGATLVDTGIADDTTRALWEAHFGRTLAGQPVARVIATHCHPDHLGNAAWIAAPKASR